jgi:signal transduction histidine kinase
MAEMLSNTPFSAQTNRLIRSGKRMNELLDSLLDYSRTSLGMGLRVVRKHCDLTPAIKEEIDILRAALPSVFIDLRASGSATGHFDLSRIREAVSNLVINAAKYGATGGVVRVALTELPDQLQFSVENEGQTIEASALEAMFEPLRRGAAGRDTEDRTSLGLGLFIVREIAKAHGGEVFAKSTDGCTVFTLRLPR